MSTPTLFEMERTVRALRPFLLDPAARGAINAKGRCDFVTAADTGVQRRVAAALGAKYPDIPFMGEEGGDHAIDPARATWVLDPIDGTTNYIFSYELCAVSLALVKGGRALLGVVYNPFTDELFAAEAGHGATANGKPIHVGGATELSDVVAVLGTMPYHKEYAPELFAMARRLYESCLDIRRSGSAALDICHTAAGRVGVFTERDLQVWDIAAGSVILSEAGGKLTDLAGDPVFLSGKTSVAASNGLLHEKLLAVIRGETP